VVRLADVAAACMDLHFGSAAAPPDAQSASVLFLPQVLHVLSLHMRQPLAAKTDCQPHTVASYLLLCGLSEKLRELFRRVEVRTAKAFEGASPLPLLLLRSMGFLSNVVCCYRLTIQAQQQATTEPSGSTGGSPPPPSSSALVLRTLRRTELFGIVSVLVSILLSDGRRERPANPGARLPQTVISLSFQAVRILNQVARLDLATLQETLGACRRQEFYHLLVCLIDYCTATVQSGKPGPGQDENELLHETIVLLGYYCLRRPENQGIVSYGEGQTLLAKITSLPLHYFMDEQGRGVLFPTILATCYQSEQNLELLRNEMNLSLLQKYLASSLQRSDTRAADADDGPGLDGRFPRALWQDALAFFSEEATSP